MRFKAMLGVALAFCLLGSVLFARTGTKAKYVGAEVCISCHKMDSLGNQFRRWLGTPHSRSWVMLQGKEAKEFAEKMGIEDPQKSPICLRCHAPVFRDTSLWCKSFHPEDGVQCEACHGPGSLHVKAMKAGRMTEEAMLPKPKGKRFCMMCHAGVPHPTGKFNYKKFWRRVAHPLPKGSRR